MKRAGAVASARFHVRRSSNLTLWRQQRSFLGSDLSEQQQHDDDQQDQAQSAAGTIAPGTTMRPSRNGRDQQDDDDEQQDCTNGHFASPSMNRNHAAIARLAGL